MKEPIVWTREYSIDQIRKINTANYCWATLFGHFSNRGHFLPIQMCVDSRYFEFELQFEEGTQFAKSFGVKGYGICTLELLVARSAYLRAWQDTIKRFPGFDQCTFRDGERLGERVLVWNNPQSYHLAATYLHHSIYSHLDSHKKNKWEKLRYNFASIKAFYEEAADPREELKRSQADLDKILLVGVNSNVLEKSPSRYMRQLLHEGILPHYSSYPVLKINPSRIYKKFFRNFSDRELVILNRHDSQKPLTNADLELRRACQKPLVAGIDQALSAGADPNCIYSDETTPLTTIIDHFKFLDTNKKKRLIIPMLQLLIEQGAHVDLCGYLESTAIGVASIYRIKEVMEFLLKNGADASIPTSYTGITEWSEPWDFLFRGSFAPGYENDIHTHECLKLLEKYAPSPYTTPGSAFAKEE